VRPQARDQVEAGALGLGLPESGPPPRAVQRAQGRHALRASPPPAHAGPFGARLDHDLATALDRPRADGQVPRDEGGVVQARGVGRDIPERPSDGRHRHALSVSGDGGAHVARERLQGDAQRGRALPVQARLERFDPGGGGRRPSPKTALPTAQRYS